MKAIKRIIFALLILIAFVFNGEIFAFYLGDFQNSFYYSTFSFDTRDRSITEADIIRDIHTASQSNGVDFFFIENTLISSFESQLKIFGTEKAFESLKDKGIHEGQVNSLFSGTIHIQFIPFDQMTGFDVISECYYLDGETNFDQLVAFKKELINIYGGGYPREGGSDKGLWTNLVTIWALAFSVNLLVTLYGIMSQRRENAIRMIQGEDLKQIFIHEALGDCISFTLILTAVYCIIHPFTQVNFKIMMFLISYFIFICVNTLAHLLVFNVNIRKHLIAHTVPQKLIVINFGLKIISVMMSIILISSQFYTINQNINLVFQGDFFENNKDFAYYNLSYMPGAKENDIYSDMWESFNKRFGSKSLEYIDYSRNLEAAYPIIIINQSAMEQISTEYPFIKEKCKGHKIVVFYPEDIQTNESINTFIHHAYRVNFRNATSEDMTKVQYKETMKVVGIDYRSKLITSLYQKPVLFYYDSLNYPELYTDRFLRTVLYNVSEEDFQSFIDDFELNHHIASQTNAYEAYQMQKRQGLRLIRMMMVLILLVVALNLAVTLLLIRMSYRYKAIELSLMKIHGYSIFQRHIPLFMASIISGLISLAGTFMLFTFGIRFIGNRRWLIVIGLGLMILDVIYIGYRVYKIEGKNIPRLLKGEKL